MVKTCFDCSAQLPISEFYARTNGRPKSYCKTCSKLRSHLHYKANKALRMRQQFLNRARFKAEARAIIRGLKTSSPCADCGEFHPYWAMDFDHRDPEQKSFNLSLFPRYASSMPKVLAEIAKCDIVCTLCHRYRTHGGTGVPNDNSPSTGDAAQKAARALLRLVKEASPCCDCGAFHRSWAMDFDHRDPRSKRFKVSRAVGMSLPVNAVLEEIAKCDLVCALCHSYRTHGEKRTART